MHIHKFAQFCSRFSGYLGTDETFGSLFTDCTEVVREYLLKLHPKQFIVSRVEIPLYKVRYSYRTVRGNEKEGEKYFFSSQMPTDPYELEIMAEGVLQNWVMDENREHPYRTIDNVKILSASMVAKSEISLEA